jgi:hypothetical protein
MFIVKPKTAKDLQEAMSICSYYHVIIKSFSDGTNPESVVLHIEEDKHHTDDDYMEDSYNQFRLCEMAFQMNFHQDGRKFLCDACKSKVEKTGEGSVCGHLTFTSVI